MWLLPRVLPLLDNDGLKSGMTARSDVTRFCCGRLWKKTGWTGLVIGRDRSYAEEYGKLEGNVGLSGDGCAPFENPRKMWQPQLWWCGQEKNQGGPAPGHFWRQLCTAYKEIEGWDYNRIAHRRLRHGSESKRVPVHTSSSCLRCTGVITARLIFCF